MSLPQFPFLTPCEFLLLFILILVGVPCLKVIFFMTDKDPKEDPYQIKLNLCLLCIFCLGISTHFINIADTSCNGLFICHSDDERIELIRSDKFDFPILRKPVLYLLEWLPFSNKFCSLLCPNKLK